MPRLLFAVVVLAVGVGCAGMGSPQDPDGVVCTTQFVFGLTVTVQNKVSGQRICDAEAVAVSGSFRETLQPVGPSEGCTYVGAGERAGIYEVSASKPGFGPVTVTNVRVSANECHVIPALVTIELEP